MEYSKPIRHFTNGANGSKKLNGKMKRELSSDTRDKPLDLRTAEGMNQLIESLPVADPKPKYEPVPDNVNQWIKRWVGLHNTSNIVGLLNQLAIV